MTPKECSAKSDLVETEPAVYLTVAKHVVPAVR